MDKILTSPNKMKIREYFEVYQLYKVYTDKVYLDFSDIYITYSLAKLSHYCLKSYKIKKQVGLMFFFFKSTIYYMGCDGSLCLQEELCMEYQYPNLFI